MWTLQSNMDPQVQARARKLCPDIDFYGSYDQKMKYFEAVMNDEELVIYEQLKEDSDTYCRTDLFPDCYGSHSLLDLYREDEILIEGHWDCCEPEESDHLISIDREEQYDMDRMAKSTTNAIDTALTKKLPLELAQLIAEFATNERYILITIDRSWLAMRVPVTDTAEMMEGLHRTQYDNAVEVSDYVHRLIAQELVASGKRLNYLGKCTPRQIRKCWASACI